MTNVESSAAIFSWLKDSTKNPSYFFGAASVSEHCQNSFLNEIEASGSFRNICVAGTKLISNLVSR